MRFPPAGAGYSGRSFQLRISVTFDFEAHLACGAGENAAGGFRILGVQVGHLDFDDLHELSLGDFANLENHCIHKGEGTIGSS